MTLTREQILAAQTERRPTRLEVPEWGGEVYIRVLTFADQVALQDSIPAERMPIHVLMHTVVDENGQRIFGDEDAEQLMTFEFPVILRIFAEAAKLNGLSTAELEAAMASFAPAPVESLGTV